MSVFIKPPCKWPKDQWRRGFKKSPRHSGIDYGYRSAVYVGKTVENESKQILAAAAGIVLFATTGGGYNQGWGNRTGIQHTDRAWTTYAHAASGTAKVKKGDVVSQGQVLAIQGSTGEVTPPGAIHVHFELYIDNERVDPAPYLAGKPLPGTPVIKATAAGTKPSGSTPYAQRTTRGKVNGRTSASTSASIRQKLDKGVVGNFDAFRRGQKVSQNGVTSNIWFRGAFGKNWFWAGNFTSQSTAGMKDVTPKLPLPVKAKKQYVVIPKPYIWYDHPNDAVAAVDRRYSVPKGNYELVRVDPRGPRLIKWNGRQVWVGSTRTRPKIIVK